MASLSHDKQIQRAELLQVLVEAVMDEVVGRYYVNGMQARADFADLDELGRAFDSMAESDDSPFWAHFKAIPALPAVIKLYRRLT
jgi:hypothetical protein